MTEVGNIQKILIVDDEAMNRDLLKVFLGTLGFETVDAENGKTALEILEKEKPDLIILDLNMPVMDGFQVLKKVKYNIETKMIPVIVVTALGDEENHLKALELGADDFLTKPFNIHFLKARLNSLLSIKKLYDLNRKYQKELEEKNIKLMNELIKTQEATIVSLATLTEFRDPETGEHLERMRGFARVLAEELKKMQCCNGYISDEYIESIFKSTPLHDIGKVGIPDHILLKPGKLTREEFEIMKTHTLIGGTALKAAVERASLDRSFLDMATLIAYHHHERWDGNGYPFGLKSDNIPLSARITTVADVYDALTSRRVYKQAFPHEKARGIILNGAGSQFDPVIVEAFKRRENDFILLKEKYKDREKKNGK